MPKPDIPVHLILKLTDHAFDMQLITAEISSNRGPSALCPLGKLDMQWQEFAVIASGLLAIAADNEDYLYVELELFGGLMLNSKQNQEETRIALMKAILAYHEQQRPSAQA